MNPEAVVRMFNQTGCSIKPDDADPHCVNTVGLSHFFSQHSRKLNRTELCDDTPGSVVYLCFFSRLPPICCSSFLLEQQQDKLICALSSVPVVIHHDPSRKLFCGEPMMTVDHHHLSPWEVWFCKLVTIVFMTAADVACIWNVFRSFWN